MPCDEQSSQFPNRHMMQYCHERGAYSMNRLFQQAVRPFKLAANLMATIVIALGLGAMTVSSASAITRTEIVRRAQIWVDARVNYNQGAYYGGYRQDCSGYLSSCWATTQGGNAYSYNTSSLWSVCYQISKNDLQPGDALLNSTNGHVTLFDHWANDAHTQYWAYEEVYISDTNNGAQHHIISYAYWNGYNPENYVPVRFRDVQDGRISLNLCTSGRYMTQEADGTINVNRSNASLWELFQITDLNGGSLMDGDKVTIQSWRGWYLSARYDLGHLVFAAPQFGPGEWETFRIRKVGVSGSNYYLDLGSMIVQGDRIALQCSEGEYLSARFDRNNSPLSCDKMYFLPNAWETFLCTFR